MSCCLTSWKTSRWIDVDIVGESLEFNHLTPVAKFALEFSAAELIGRGMSSVHVSRSRSQVEFLTFSSE
jgi:hypothetical protein